MMNKMKLNCFFTVLFTCSFLLTGTLAQNVAAPAKKGNSRAATLRQLNEMQQTDSLQQIIAAQTLKLDSLDTILDTERQTNADLREQLIKLDDYRKKLEGNVDSFKGENLKLNQSNRILIVFNSLVAVLLITSLVFFLRKIGRKKTEPSVINTPAGGKQNSQVKFTNFEDKLAQLERLGKLREKQLLTEEEFIVEKQNILGK